MKTRNYIIAAVLAVAITFTISNVNVKANQATNIKSNGRIIHDNKTPDNPADDVIIFDAEDLKTLETNLKDMETRIAAAKARVN